MTKAWTARAQGMFVLAGFLSALLTLTLGALWVSVLMVGTGGIFAAMLLATDSLWGRFEPASQQRAFSRKLLAAIVIAISYLCCALVYVAVVTAVDSLGFRINRDSLFAYGVGPAALIGALGFYLALKIFTNVNRTVLLQLVLIALLTAIVSGAVSVWGANYLILRPHLFVSPVWVTLLLVGETGFAWVWAKTTFTSSQPLHPATTT